MIKKFETHILKLSCKDQIGIVAKISSILARFNCNIVESKQFTDQENKNFFIRQSFTLIDEKSFFDLQKNLNSLAIDLNGDFFLTEIKSSINTVILVSKFDHCLNDLLFRVRNDSLSLNVKAIISNHKTAQEIASFYEIPFYHLPIDKLNKLEQETKIKKKKVVPEKVKKVVVPKIILKKEKIKRSGLDYKKSNNESKEIVLETKEIVDDYDDDSSSVSSLSSVSYVSSLSSVSSCSDSTDDDDDDILENKTMNNYNDDSDSSNNSKSSDISNKCSSNCKTDKEDFSEPVIFRPKSRFF